MCDMAKKWISSWVTEAKINETLFIFVTFSWCIISSFIDSLLLAIFSSSRSRAILFSCVCGLFWLSTKHVKLVFICMGFMKLLPPIGVVLLLLLVVVEVVVFFAFNRCSGRSSSFSRFALELHCSRMKSPFRFWFNSEVIVLHVNWFDTGSRKKWTDDWGFSACWSLVSILAWCEPWNLTRLCCCSSWSSDSWVVVTRNSSKSLPALFSSSFGSDLGIKKNSINTY